MANFVFNVALGRERTYYDNVKGNSPANSAFVWVVLAASGLEADATLRDHDTLATLLAGTSNEATNGNYGRKTITDADLAASAQDDSNDRLELDQPDQTWNNVAAGDTWGKVVICYDPDTTGGDDTTLVPVTAHDFSVVPDGTPITAQVATNGTIRLAG